MAIEGITSASLYAQQLLRRQQGRDLGDQTPAIDRSSTLPPRTNRVPPPQSYDNGPGFGSDGGQRVEVPRTAMKWSAIGPPSYGGGDKKIDGDDGTEVITPTPTKAGQLPPPQSYDNGPGFGSDDPKEIEPSKTGMDWYSVGPPSYGDGDKHLGGGDPGGKNIDGSNDKVRPKFTNDGMVDSDGGKNIDGHNDKVRPKFTNDGKVDSDGGKKIDGRPGTIHPRFTNDGKIDSDAGEGIDQARTGYKLARYGLPPSFDVTC